MKFGSSSWTGRDCFLLCSDVSLVGFTFQFCSGCLLNSWISLLATFGSTAKIACLIKSYLGLPSSSSYSHGDYYQRHFFKCVFEIFIYLIAFIWFTTIVLCCFYSQKFLNFSPVPAPSNCYFLHSNHMPPT